jgi:ATP-dependent RNA helicase RhlE
MTALLNFSDLGLVAPILGAVAAEGYTSPTPIQFHHPAGARRARSVRHRTNRNRQDRRLGPTILQRLAAAKQRTAPQTWRALVLSPTRELASQIAASFRAYGAGIPLSMAVVFGGVPIGPQRQNLAHGVDILVATPGRLLDLIDMHRGRFVSGLSAPPVADQTQLGRSSPATSRPFPRRSIRWRLLTASSKDRVTC